MKIQRPRTLERNERLQIANHVIFMGGLLFIAHQNMLHPAPARTEVPIVAQALNAQPRTPPPAFDPEQVSVEEIDPSAAPE